MSVLPGFRTQQRSLEFFTAQHIAALVPYGATALALFGTSTHTIGPLHVTAGGTDAPECRVWHTQRHATDWEHQRSRRVALINSDGLHALLPGALEDLGDLMPSEAEMLAALGETLPEHLNWHSAGLLGLQSAPQEQHAAFTRASFTHHHAERTHLRGTLSIETPGTLVPAWPVTYTIHREAGHVQVHIESPGGRRSSVADIIPTQPTPEWNLPELHRWRIEARAALNTHATAPSIPGTLNA